GNYHRLIQACASLDGILREKRPAFGSLLCLPVCLRNVNRWRRRNLRFSTRFRCRGDHNATTLHIRQRRALCSLSLKLCSNLLFVLTQGCINRFLVLLFEFSNFLFLRCSQLRGLLLLLGHCLVHFAQLRDRKSVV